jgi:hypothetical protein
MSEGKQLDEFPEWMLGNYECRDSTHNDRTSNHHYMKNMCRLEGGGRSAELVLTQPAKKEGDNYVLHCKLDSQKKHAENKIIEYSVLIVPNETGFVSYWHEDQSKQTICPTSPNSQGLARAIYTRKSQV